MTRRPTAERSVVLPVRGFRWRGVALEHYRGFAGAAPGGATRQVLMAGSAGAAIRFDVRYFELAPLAHTRFETHAHAHVVMAVRGTGRVRLGGRWVRLGRFGACYVAPGAAHQLHNDGRRRFGFLCIVDAERDRGRPVRPPRDGVPRPPRTARTK